MKILVACEESQTVCKAFRDAGFDAYSCDIIDCSGDHPEWHIKGDTIKEAYSRKYDLMIAHPPCTYLTVTGNKWMKPEFKNRFPDRINQRNEAILFFMMLILAPVEKIAVENPVGIMSTRYRKPTQYIEPFWFGDNAKKKTGLWLKNLPPLEPTNMVEPELYTYKNGRKDPMWHMESKGLPSEERTRVRSKTFQGIADAMVQQWGALL